MPKIPTAINSPLLFPTDKGAIFTLENDARKLKYIAAKVWRMYYNSYKPTVYRRTGNTALGIKMTGIQKDGVIGYKQIITFEDEKMYHRSYVHPGQPRGHALMLISSGWKSKKLEERIGKRPRYTQYRGFNYLGRVKKEYLDVRHKGVSFRISWRGNDNLTR